MANLQATVVNGVLNSLRTENTKTGNHTLEAADRDKVVNMNNASSATVTIPNDSSYNFPIGSIVYINRTGAGGVTLAVAGGVSINKTGTVAINEEFYVRKRAANQWVIVDVPSTLGATSSGATESEAGGFAIFSFTSTGGGSLTLG